MEGFALLLGHIVGDYLVQNDFLAKNKTNPHPGPEPKNTGKTEDLADLAAWCFAKSDYTMGHIACTIHCLLYTLSVWAFSFTWMPLWGLLACFALHWPIDRFRLARVWMENVSGQREFANGPLSPWSIIVVDNTFHLLTLYGIWAVHNLT